ncbi:MAG: amino acid ABC transporter ATP-binding protein [Chlorobiaceae bacterium]|nr:amino acid ABC transporter ATP-binding protein [Chlorobiaceae bacterium]NTW74893.1 amino acid ABC transporter ATP-binding protein [Chlorobiaceae bacterium]
MITIKGLTTTVQGTKLLNNVNLELKPGRILGIIGPSGNGKTTLLMCLCGLLPFENGTITVGGKTLRAEESGSRSETIWEFRKKSGIVFQHLHLFPHLTVLGNIIEAPVHVNRTPKAEAERQAIDLLAKLGIEQHRNKYPEELSGGEQQRVAILRALSMNPEVLLLDEPTSALDPIRSGDVRKLLQEFAASGHTVVIVSHSVRFLKGIADELAFMGKSEMIEMNSTQELLENPRDERTREFLSYSELN